MSQKLIRQKCEQTGTVGFLTSGAGLIPGVGAVAALVLGTAADIGATFKLQAELVGSHSQPDMGGGGLYSPQGYGLAKAPMKLSNTDMIGPARTIC